jgi:ADP-ribose pyrophosphatase
VAILPTPPSVDLEVVGERSNEREGFLSLRRHNLVVVQGAAKSRAFPYDTVGRRALDAAVMVAHYRDASGARQIYLRSAVRPPLVLRDDGAAPPSSVLWEVAAGLIEPGEAPAAAAARELEEELGFHVGAAEMRPLGPTAYPAPGLVGEVHHYFHLEVDPAARAEPQGDGSPLEEASRIIAVPLDRALAACRAGEITDAKTELALRRLAEIV